MLRDPKVPCWAHVHCAHMRDPKGRFFAAVCIQRCVFSIAFFSKNIAGKFLNHPDCKSSVMNSAGFMAAKVAARVAAALFGPKSAIFMPRNHKRR